MIGPVVVNGVRYPVWSPEAISWQSAVEVARRDFPVDGESYNDTVCRIRESLRRAKGGAA
jgi:hypothetical protein